MVLAILTALALSFWMAKLYGIPRETVFDLAFWLIIGGLLGARIYDDLLQLPYYLQHPLQIFSVWNGGLAIHGALIAGWLVAWFFAKRRGISFWRLVALIAPGLALGQAIGRWGNYFNQEIFGLPTAWVWGIPIEAANRPLQYISNQYFHPTFLYESLGCLLISAILVIFNVYRLKNGRQERYFDILAVALYVILYSILRFSLEFIRLDPTPLWLGLRWPQAVSLSLIVTAILLISFKHHEREKNSQG